MAHRLTIAAVVIAIGMLAGCRSCGRRDNCRSGCCCYQTDCASKCCREKCKRTKTSCSQPEAGQEAASLPDLQPLPPLQQPVESLPSPPLPRPLSDPKADGDWPPPLRRAR